MRKPRSHHRAGKLAGKLFLLLVGLALLAFLAPTIIAKTDLRNLLLGKVLPGNVLRATAGGASLGWFSPSELTDVKLVDINGDPLLTAASIQMARTPAAILGNRNQLGQVTIESPTLYLRVGTDGSNLEHILRALNPPDKTAQQVDANSSQRTPLPNLTVRINNGVVYVEDLVSGQVWRADGVTADFSTASLVQGLVQLTASGQVVPGNAAPTAGPIVGNGPGAFALTLAPTDNGRQQADLRVSALPMESLTAWLRRTVDAPELHGVLTAESSSTWKPIADVNSGQMLPTGFTSGGYLVMEQLDFSSAALSGDHIRMAQVDVPWRISTQGPAIVLEELAMRGDLGELSARGTINTLSLQGNASPEMLSQQDLQIRGNLDLAKLAAMLPRALSIREDTRITSGGLRLLVENRPHNKVSGRGGVRLVGSLKTDQLAATTGGKPLRWDQPIRIDFDTIWQQNQFQIESLACESSFCRITASGNDRKLRANAEFDLDRLATELSQFVDLSDWRPAGSGTAELLWQKTPNRRFVADGSFHLQDFALQSQGQTVWAEPRLDIAVKAGGALDEAGRQPTRVDQATITLRAEGDSLDAQLKSVVDLHAAQPSWPIQLTATGDAGRWLARLRPFVDSGDWQIAGKRVSGNMELASNLLFAPELTELSNTTLRLTRFRAHSNDWQIDEPRIEFAGDMRWDGAKRQLVSRQSQLICSSFSLEARDVEATLPVGGMPQMLGNLAVRADLARVGAMRRSNEWQTGGMVTGNLAFQVHSQGSGDQIAADLDLRGDNLSLTSKANLSQPVWQEPQLSVTGRASFQQSAQRIVLDQFRVNSQTLAMMASGSVDRLSTTRDVNLQGTVDYDLAQITPLLQPYLGPGVTLVGRKQARFEIVGPLAEVASGPASRLASSITASAASAHWSQTLRGGLQAPWDSAGVFGLPIGPGQVSAKLATGGVQFDPLQVAIGQGRLDIAPFVRLDPEPSQLELPRGQVLTNIDISREVSETMLKYIAPVLADATRSEGVFSMQLEGGVVPLDDPQQADITGKLTIHNVQVLPGPSTEKWVGIAQQIEDLIQNRNPRALTNRPPKTILRIRDRTVPFRLAQGRVYHEQMEFNVGEVIVRSQGSVGLDESLSITLSVPFLDKWIESTPFLSGLRGQSVQIPVGGTLSQPQIDARAVASLSTQLLRSAAQEALGGQLNRALEGLFGRPKQGEQQ